MGEAAQTESGRARNRAATTHRSRGRRWVQRAFGVLFGLVMAWLMMEVVLRVAFDALPADVQGTIEHVRAVPWRDDRIVPVPPWTADVDYQTILTPGLRHYRVGRGESLFHIDSLSLWGARAGLRTNPPQWPVDLAVVGDSFTLCWTELDDCWVERLHRDYGWSVMNLGMAGTGARSHLLALKNFAVPLEPRVVIWQWYGNDANDDYGLGLLRGDYDALDAPPVLETKPDFGWLARYSAVYALIRDRLWSAHHDSRSTWGQAVEIFGKDIRVGDDYNLYGFDLSRPSNALGWELSVEAMDEAARILEDEMGAALVVVLIPTREEVYADYVEDVLGANYLENLREGRLRMQFLCADRGWTYLDPTERLQAEVEAGRHVYFGSDLHLNPHGNAVLAEVVGEWLAAHPDIVPAAS